MSAQICAALASIRPAKVLAARCVRSEDGNYLAIKPHADLTNNRVDNYRGDIVRNGDIADEWDCI